MNIHFLGKRVRMVVVQPITSIVRLKKLKLKQHFIEMITATVSHDMRTPLNAIIGLSANLINFVSLPGRKLLRIV